MTALPADRGSIDTEARNPRTMDLSGLDVSTCLSRLHTEDQLAVAAVGAAHAAVAAFITEAEPGFRRGGRLVYVGAGTSGRLGVLDASECPPTFQVEPGRVIGIIAGGDAALRRSSEGLEDDPAGALAELHLLQLGPDDSVLGIASGGTTPYVRGALEWCAVLGTPPVTGLLTCARVDPPCGVRHMLFLDTGPEAVTGSTRMKAGTATKLVLNAISTTLMVRCGRVYENLMVDLRATNDKLRDRAARIVSTLCAVDRSSAFALLDAAGGVTKVAILMHRLGLAGEAARARLRACDGNLGRALEGA